jgi:DnaJ-class molecular chaperone
MKPQTFKDGSKEIACIACDGTGMVEEPKEVYRVRVCPSCNGHGIVIYSQQHGVTPYKENGQSRCRVVHRD